MRMLPWRQASRRSVLVSIRVATLTASVNGWIPGPFRPVTVRCWGCSGGWWLSGAEFLVYPAPRLARSEGEGVHQFVFGVAHVAACPLPLQLMPGTEFEQAFPQVPVLDRGLAGGLPAVALPVGQ